MSCDALYVFGDQSLELLGSVQRLNQHCRQNHTVRGFVRAALDSVHHAISTVPAHLRPKVSQFNSLLQLAEAVEEGSRSPALVACILTIVQIGEFIAQLSSTPCLLDGSSGSPAFLGLCTGSLSAAAVAASRNVTELLDIAPYIVDLSFTVGLEAWKRSQNLEAAAGSWSIVIKDIENEEVQDILETFNKTINNSSHRRVYISAICDSSTTVSGPPSIIQKLLQYESRLSNRRRLQLPINAAYHARHLIPVPHSRIFHQSGAQLCNRRLQHLVLSPYSGRYYSSTDLVDVLHEIVNEVFQQPINWCQIMSQLPDFLSPSAKMTSFGPFIAPKGLSEWMDPCHTSQKATLSTDSVVRPSQEDSGAIAVVGMSIRAPGSETLEEFWNVLQEGKDLHRGIPTDRFDAEAYVEAQGEARKGKFIPYGVFLDRPGYFDPRFFNMSPREAFQTDPQQRLMLLTTYEALENAGYSPNRTPSSQTRRIASFLGQTGDDYREFNANQGIDAHFITGNIRAFGPGRVNYHFGWEGPSFSVDTACSSSGASIQLACSALLSRDCDTAVCGGANLLTSPDLFAGLSSGGFLSKTGRCQTFDKEADGYVRGEACGVVVLKRLQDAVSDHDRVLAVLRGATTNHSADACSITHPHEETQERLFADVLDKAGVLPQQVDLAEIHGTGTQAGDVVESGSVTNVLCRGRNSPLFLSTVKPIVGHGEAASGVTSIIKAILMLQKDKIPPHTGIKNCMNDRLPLFEQKHVRICSEEASFLPRAGGDGKRRILVNNFDAAGGNTSMLLEDPPQARLSSQDSRSHKVVAISAKSATSLQRNIHNLSEWCRAHPDTRVEDLAYTTTARRSHHLFRRAYTAASLEELVVNLAKVDHGESPPRASKQPHIVFCFTGQGASCLSMASNLYTTHPMFRETIDDYAMICDSHNFPSFLPIIRGDHVASQCPIRSQLLLIAVELGLASLWRSWNVHADVVIGHSLGEYAALCHAGVISPSDCFFLVGKRAELIAGKCFPDTCSMLAIQASVNTVLDHVNSLQINNIEVACQNSPTSTVVSGPLNDIQHLRISFKVSGLGTKLLPARHAFHSSQLDVILKDFESIARSVCYNKPNVPIASTLLGDIVSESGIFNSEYLRSQTREAVRFESAINSIFTSSLADAKTAWIEIGPNPLCLGMAKAARREVTHLLPSLIQGKEDWQVLSSAVASAYEAGVGIDWSEFHRPFEPSLQLLQLPNYSFDLKNYWMRNKSVQKQNQNSQSTELETACIPQTHKFSPTVCLHRIEKDESDSDTINLTFAADISDPALNVVLNGHVVNGVPLCSSSVYAEMAFTVATYIRDLLNLESETLLAVDDMTVSKPLIVDNEASEQIIRVAASKTASSHEIHLRYSSQAGSVCENHATCTVRLVHRSNSTALRPDRVQNIRARLDRLQQSSSEGRAHSLLRPMVYKLFRNFVDYKLEYQGLEQVFLDTNMLEAAANVRFHPADKEFTCNPHWIDSIAHLSGFVLNGTDFTPDDSVFISHGWKRLEILGTLSPHRSYQSYVRMKSSQCRNILTGDVHLLDGDEIVAIFEDIKFQQVRRALLNQIIPCGQSMAASYISRGHQLIQRRPLTEKSSPIKPVACTPTEKKTPATEFMFVMDTIARELGIELSEMTDETEFLSLGVDSLMTTNILAVLGTKFDIFLPASVFVECPSVGELRAQLATRYTSASIDMSPVKAGSIGTNGVEDEASTNATLTGFDRALAVVGQELDVEITELQDDIHFADLGLDSILAINTVSRLSNLMDKQLPGSFFVQYPTVACLRHFCRQAFSPIQSTDNATSTVCTTSHRSGTKALRRDTSPAEVGGSHVRDHPTLENIMSGTECTTAAGEVGVNVGDIQDDVPRVESKTDGITFPCIPPRVTQEVGATPNSTSLADDSNFSAARDALRATPVPRSPAVDDTTKNCSPLAPLRVRSHIHFAPLEPDTRTWSASSILLQGSPSSNEPCLFLIPDGSGSSSSYLGLPQLNFTGAVYSLNSPFLRNPDCFKISVEELVALYIAEILRIQPSGPYRIGGWSFGGICAFEAASQLIRKHGQEIQSLVLIDAPCPTKLPPLPVEDIDFLQSIGVFETLRSSCKSASGAPVASRDLGLRDGIREHFAGTLDALGRYQVEVIERSKSPRNVLVLWASCGVWETLDREMRLFSPSASRCSKNRHPTTTWLMDARPSFGTCGWDELLPGSNFTCHSVEGDHFSMMRRPGVMEMGPKISLSLGRP